MPTQAERAAATRAKLLAVARKLFASRGYAATSLDDLVRRAGMTKGAFYHHFPSKQAIFRAVFEETEAQLVAAAHARSHGRDAVERFRNACHAFLEACLDPAVQRIVMTDGPAVLGWATWREIDWRYWLAGIEAGLASAMAEGLVRTRPTKPLAHVIFGALCESANVIARASDPRRALVEVRRELDAVLAGLLVSSGSGRRRRPALQA